MFYGVASLNQAKKNEQICQPFTVRNLLTIAYFMAD